MTKSKKNPKVDEYILNGCGRCELAGTPRCKVHNWEEELETLRMIVLKSGLNEERKWGMPCYTLDGGNVIMIAAFKEYCAVSFFKGVLLKDPKKILSKPGENSQTTRQLRFTNVRDIVKIEPVIKAYIMEAIEIEKAGLKPEMNAKSEIVYADELTKKLDEMPALKKAFAALTPGRRRAYNIFFSAPKQSATRVARIERCIPQILKGKGLNDWK